MKVSYVLSFYLIRGIWSVYISQEFIKLHSFKCSCRVAKLVVAINVSTHYEGVRRCHMAVWAKLQCGKFFPVGLVIQCILLLLDVDKDVEDESWSHQLVGVVPAGNND